MGRSESVVVKTPFCIQFCRIFGLDFLFHWTIGKPSEIKLRRLEKIPKFVSIIVVDDT
jgi:hypothetical protein